MKNQKTIFTYFMPQVVFMGLFALLVQHTAFASVQTKNVSSSQPIASLKNLSSVTSSDFKTLSTPKIHDFTTSKGTRVLFVQANELPIVDIRLTFNAGSARDTWVSKEFAKNAQGTAALTAAMLNKGFENGTLKQTENDIAKEIELNGFNFSAKAYKDMFAVSMRSLSSPAYLQKASKLLNNMLAHPSFPDESLARLKSQTIIGIEQAAQRPSSIAAKAFSKHLYGSHPYALSSTGTLASVPNISKEKLAAFKGKFLVAKNASIALTGKLSLAQAKKLAESMTADLPVGKAAPQLPMPKPPKAQHIHIPFESNQTTIIVGQLGITRKDPKLYDLVVANDILGGGDFQALLMRELRKKRGLTYGAYSGFTPMQVTGPFSLSFSTRNDKAKLALKVTKRTLRNYLRKGASKASIHDAKLSMVNQFPLSMATNASINNTLAMMAFYGLPTDYMEDYTLNIMAVTQHSANTAFRRKIDARKLLIITVGPKKP